MIDLIPSITHLGSYTPVAITSLMLAYSGGYPFSISGDIRSVPS